MGMDGKGIRETAEAEIERMEASGCGLIPFCSWQLGPEWDEILDKDSRDDQAEEF